MRHSDLSADFLHFGANDFPSKNPFKKCFKIVFFSLWRRDPVLELQFPTPLRVVLLCFAIQRLQIALQWLRQGCLMPRLHAQYYYCVLQLDLVNSIGVAATRLRQ